MPNSEYWERRQVEDAYRVFQDAESVADQISALYHKSSVYISKEIQNIFERFKVKWGLTDKEAWDLIGTMRDTTDIDELLQKLQSTTQTDNVRELRKQIETSAYRARIERLADLMGQLDTVMRSVYRQELKKNTDLYRKLAEEAYYRSMYNLQQRAGVAFSFAHIDHKAIDKVISMNWSGKHFSKRIWNNTQALADTVKQELLVNLVTGRTEREAANSITERFAQGAGNARRLIRTESNYVSTELNFMAYEEAGVEEYLYLATLDLRTSKICRELDGKIFKVSKKQVGENCPPMHPWCRSTTIAIIDRDLLKDMTRRARDPETGKTYTVPLTMNYKQWYKEYVEGHPEAEINEEKVKNKASDDKGFTGLAAKIGGDEVPIHEEPELIRNIIPDDELAIEKELQAFADKYRDAEEEHAYVITKEGKVYHCFGTEGNVYPDYDLGDELYGAHVTHNHPERITEYTFSGEDIELFQKYNLASLHGCDVKYDYKLGDKSIGLDDLPDDWRSLETFHHSRIINWCRKLEIGYRRNSR